MTLASKVETLAWYLRRPHLYREMFRRISHGRVTTAKFWEQGARDKDAGRAWCQANISSRESVASALGLANLSFRPISELHPAEWAFAKRAEETCPVKMGGAAHLDLLYSAARALGPEVMVETGVASGWSTLAILLAMRENKKGHLYSSDMPYAKLNNEDFVGCVVPTELRDRWTLSRKPDRDVLPELLATIGSLDVIHHDSDKSYDGRMFVYQSGWAKLRPGGLLLSDDVEDNLAFRDFARSVGRDALVLVKQGENFAGVLKK